MFFGPNTHRFNPSSIAAGKIRAVGAYLPTGPGGVEPAVDPELQSVGCVVG
jgi:hypothetical protein